MKSNCDARPMTQLELPGIAVSACPRADDNGRMGRVPPAAPVRPFRILDEVVRLILIRIALQTVGNGAALLMRRDPASLSQIDLRPMLT